MGTLITARPLAARDAVLIGAVTDPSALRETFIFGL